MLKVMTFNIKNTYKKEINGKIVSERIKEIFKIIEKENPDILGLQEVTEEVKKTIENTFLNYYFIGRSRYNNGNKTDEYNLIMIKKKYEIKESATYSLGNNVNLIGSKGFFDIFPRICTYVKIKYDNKEIGVYNTHLDHLLSYNRKRQMQLIESFVKDTPAIIMGDLNVDRNNKILKGFLNKNYLDAANKLSIPTFGHKYIDHILCSPEFIFTEVYVNCYDNYPSDHYPIIVKTKLK